MIPAKVRAPSGIRRASMDQLDLGRAVIVGHSMSSLVAARLAIDHPDRVAAPVLIDAFMTLKGNAAPYG